MIQKPQRLEPGDTIGIVAPAFQCPDEKLKKGIAKLEGLGYKVKIRKDVNKGWGYLSDTDKKRAGDIMKMFTDPSIKAIICTRGGWGAMRVWPFLDLKKIKKNPKIFVGYSDITSLHIAFSQLANMVSFHGPMVASCLGGNITPYSEKLYWRILTDPKPLGELPLPPKRKIIKIRGGKATGRLAGGNICLVCASLGTKYQPNYKGSILLLEEIGEDPYGIDRNFSQLQESGILKQVKGIVLGDFTDCTPPKNRPKFTVMELAEQYLKPLGIPVLANFPFGHSKHNAIMPIGLRVELDGNKNKLSFLEGAVK